MKPRRRPNCLYVVEISFNDGLTWEPTVGAGLTRSGGREKVKEWRKMNPADKFRLRVYRSPSPEQP